MAALGIWPNLQKKYDGVKLKIWVLLGAGSTHDEKAKKLTTAQADIELTEKSSRQTGWQWNKRETRQILCFLSALLCVKPSA
jgi:alkaline phosphatase